MKTILICFACILMGTADLAFAIEPGKYVISNTVAGKDSRRAFRGLVLEITKDGEPKLEIGAHENDVINVTKISIIKSEDKEAFILHAEWTLSEEKGRPGLLEKSSHVLCLTFSGENGSGVDLELGSSQAVFIESSIGRVAK